MRHFFAREYIKKFLQLFFLGMIIGILAMYIGKKYLLTQSGLLDEYCLIGVKYLEPDYVELFFYTLWKRIKVVLIMILAAAIIRYGVKGIWLIFVSLFPQAIFYIPAFIFLFHLCYLLCIGIYFPGKNIWEEYATIKAAIGIKIIKFLIAIGVVIIGVVFESYVNSNILINFLKNF